mmetsp:Transcript_112575/g.323553  ORF Transcript_112575/g.323553 Transcript_112575/m.323553 type:complete len:119 (-) Transcript_112575:382-738(-)
MLFGSDMRQDFLLQNTLGITNTIILCHISCTSTTSNKVQCYFLTLDDKCLFQTWTEEIHHFSIGQIVDHMFDNVTIGHVSQGPENDNHRYISSNVGKGTADLISFNGTTTTFLIHLNV